MPMYDFRCADGHDFERMVLLADFDQKQACQCGATAQRLIRGVRIVRGFAEPVQSMADGKYYSSPAALERTYKADGNPQGVEYLCVGERVAEPYKRPPKDEKKLDAAISRACEEAGL